MSKEERAYRDAVELANSPYANGNNLEWLSNFIDSYEKYNWLSPQQIKRISQMKGDIHNRQREYEEYDPKIRELLANDDYDYRKSFLESCLTKCVLSVDDKLEIKELYQSYLQLKDEAQENDTKSYQNSSLKRENELKSVIKVVENVFKSTRND